MSATIKDLETALLIDKHDLDEENLKQPQLINDAGKGVATTDALKREAAYEVEFAYAELDAQVRKAASENDEKISETQIKMRIALMPRMKTAEKALRIATKALDDWKVILESIRQRGYSIRELDSLYLSNYYAKEAGGKQREDVRTAVADRNRKEAGRLIKTREQRHDDT